MGEKNSYSNNNIWQGFENYGAKNAHLYVFRWARNAYEYIFHIVITLLI